MGDTIDLGPLPQADRSNQNQQRSLSKLISTLPVERLRFRDERTDDFGVDGSLEVHINGRVTNFRAAVQLKSREETDANKDGSISFKAKVTNLVYLLNGTSPMYVLYLVDTDRLMYAWVRDEVTRISSTNEDWKTQEFVTLHFNHTLDAAACDAIHERLLREGLFSHRVSQLMSTAARGELRIAVNVETLNVTDAREIESLIRDMGLALTTAGFPKQVIEKSALLAESSREGPDIALALGYAEYTRGHHSASDAHLAFARVGRAQLESKKQLLLDLLSNACDVELARISREQYLANEAKLLGDTGGPLKRHHESRVLWERYLQDRRPDRVVGFVEALRKLVRDSELDSSESQESRLELKESLLTAETDSAIGDLITNRAQQQISARAGLPWFDREQNPNWEGTWNELIRRQQEVAREADVLGNPTLISKCRALVAYAEFQLCLVTRMMSISLGEPAPNHDEKIYQLMPVLDEARVAAERSGLLDDELRYTLTIAEMFMALGNESAAKAMAATVRDRAAAFRYVRLVDRSSPLADGDWYIERIERELRQIRDVDEDILSAAQTDSDVERMARDSMIMMEFPPDRFPAVLREHLDNRMVAREKLNHCRFLHRIENLEHTASPETIYTVTPEQVFVCDLHQYKSPTSSTDATRLLSDFKRVYCVKCTSRDPKLK